jgi:hypothetical protein
MTEGSEEMERGGTMSEISDELRRLASDAGAGLRDLAGRVDAETVELPRDGDGAPIRVGDTVYERGDLVRRKHVDYMTLCKRGWIVYHGPFVIDHGSCTHEPQDSWGRVADELDALAEGEAMAHGVRADLRGLARRVRALAEREAGDGDS